MNKIKLLIIDEKMTSIEVEINNQQFQLLGIDKTKAFEHKYKSELNSTVTKFLKSFKEGE